MTKCEWYGCTIDHERKPRPLRWHVCVKCGWNDLMQVGSKPWTCDLCKKKEQENGKDSTEDRDTFPGFRP